MQNFQALGAPPPNPRAFGGWGFAHRPQIASGCWGLRSQTRKTAPSIANF